MSLFYNILFSNFVWFGQYCVKVMIALKFYARIDNGFYCFTFSAFCIFPGHFTYSHTVRLIVEDQTVERRKIISSRDYQVYGNAFVHVRP